MQRQQEEWGGCEGQVVTRGTGGSVFDGDRDSALQGEGLCGQMMVLIT